MLLFECRDRSLIQSGSAIAPPSRSLTAPSLYGTVHFMERQAHNKLKTTERRSEQAKSLLTPSEMKNLAAFAKGKKSTKSDVIREAVLAFIGGE